MRRVSHQLNSVAAAKIRTMAAQSSGRVSVLRPQMLAISSPTRSTCTVGRVDAHGVVVGLRRTVSLSRVTLAVPSAMACWNSGRSAWLGRWGVHDGVHGVCGIVDKGRGLAVKQHGAVAADKRKARRINARFRQQADQRFGVVGGLGLVGGGVAAAQLGQVVVHAVGVAALEQNGGAASMASTQSTPVRIRPRR